MDTNLKPKPKKVRKKGMYHKLAGQMDFYFGDANLRRDRFMKKEIDSSADGYLPLELFMSFNKIKEMSVSTEDMSKAISLFSKLLEVDSTKTKVKRTKPLPDPSTENVDSRIVYVEGIPLKSTHDWVKSEFSVYGGVAYITLPRYQSTGDIKGFAFIEFEEVDGAQKCLNAVGTKEFNSVHPFPKVGSKDIQRMQKALGQTDSSLNPKKKNKKRSSASTDTSLVENQKAEFDQPQAKKPKSDSDGGTTDAATESDAAGAGTKASDTDGNVSDTPGKANRKRKRRSSHTKIKEGLEEVKEEGSSEKNPKQAKMPDKTPEDKPDKKTDGKQLSKKSDNRKMKRESDSVKEKQETDNAENQPGKKNTSAVPKFRAISKSDWLRLKKQFLELQKIEMSALKKKLREQKAAEPSSIAGDVQASTGDGCVDKLTVAVEHLQMTPGVIVQISSESELVKSKIKSAIPDLVEVAYIDTQIGSNSGYIRCHSGQDAQILLEKSCGENYQLKLLTGDDEKAYWDKLNNQRMTQRQTGDKKKKRESNKKGTQKVVDQAKKLNNRTKKKKSTRIVFDDDE